MVTLSQSRWAVRAITAVVWAMAAASALYWGLKSSSSTAPAPLPTTAAAATAIDPLAVSRMLGATASQAAPQVNVASRFSLQGVIAGAPGGGAALISVDGKPAMPFRVGSLVDEGLVLQTTGVRRVTLAASRDGPAVVTLEMPLLNP